MTGQAVVVEDGQNLALEVHRAGVFDLGDGNGLGLGRPVGPHGNRAEKRERKGDDPAHGNEFHFAGELVDAWGAGLTCNVIGAEYKVNVTSLPGAFLPSGPGFIGLPAASPCNAKV